MSIKPLIQITPDQLLDTNNVLRSGISDVVNFDDDLLKKIQDIKDTLHHHDIAIGLAAPQIGLPLKIAVINLKTKDESDTILVNPKITSTTGKKDQKHESCMSLPHFGGDVTRRDKVTVSYQDEYGNLKDETVKGFRARVYCHEIDHLNGILYTDRMSEESTLKEVDIFK